MPELTLHSDFAGGNAITAQVLGRGHLGFEVDLHGGERGLWFYFRVTDSVAGALTFDILNGRHLIGWPHFDGIRPVYGRPGAWQRAPAPASVLADAGVVRFQIPAERETCVAFCYPYVTADLDRFRARLRADPRVREATVAHSPRGHPVHVWEVGTGPCGVWITARHHAGETPGSYLIEGLLDELLDPRRASLLSRARFRVCPMVDTDNVESGAYGKYGPPCDPYMDWTEHPTLPQVAALQRYFALAAERPHLFIDLHSPEPCGATFAATWEEPEVGATYLRRVQDFCHLLHEESGDPLRLDMSRTHGRPDWFGDSISRSSQGYFRERHGCLALTLEVAYHWSRAGQYPDEPAYRELGAALCRAIDRECQD